MIDAAEGDNYAAAENLTADDWTFTIAEATPVYTPPTPKTGLTYNGGVQQLINEGTVTNGTMYYSLDQSLWMNEAPYITGTDATDYTVYWKIAGAENYSVVAIQSITAKIAAEHSDDNGNAQCFLQ